MSASKPRPGRLGGLGEQARLGQAGDRVGLEHEGLGALEHEVDPGEAAQPSVVHVPSATSVTRSATAGSSSAGQTKVVRPIS